MKSVGKIASGMGWIILLWCAISLGGGTATEREQVIEMIQSLPEDSTVDDIMEELFFRLQVDRGLKELDEGRSVSHEEVKDMLSRWLQK